MVIYLFRLTCSIVLWRGRDTANKYHWRGGECSQSLGHSGFAPVHGMCAFPVYTAQAPGCSAGELSKAGLGLCVLPRSKPLRFRFLGTSQRHRLSWVCFLCPSQVLAAQVTRCLVSALSLGGAMRLTPYMTTGKTIVLTRQTLVGKVMSLLFNMLSRLVITFLPRSKRLLISWLQSPSAVILEPPK